MLLQGFSNRQERADSNSPNLSDIALNRIHDAIYLIDRELGIQYVNDKACKLMGYSRKEFSQLTFSTIDRELLDSDVFALWWKLSIRPEGITFTSQHACRNGELIPVEVSSSSYDNQGLQQILCVVHDVRELRRKEEQQRLREKQMNTVVENSPDLIARFDLNMCCVYANPAVRRWFNRSEREIHNWQLTESVPLGDVGLSFFKLISQTLVDEQGAENELTFDREGSKQVLHVRCVPEYNLQGKMVSVLAVGRDITLVRQTEDELRAAHQQLRMLTRNQELTREVERKQLARDIHDELGQHLTSLRTGLSLLSMREHEGSAVIQAQLENLMGLVDSTIQVVRDVSTRLRPNVLNLGLIPALEWLRDQFMKNGGCRCILVAPDEHRVQLDEAAMTATFRVVQESLTNAARHASASNIYIIVKPQPDTLVVEVVDNGKGFHVNRVQKNAFGLLGIQERGRMLNGDATVTSSPGKGTRIKLTVPLSAASKNHKKDE
ncbi:PAS domain S-box protein [Erwiniaceae bacterium BAC15a-03b]|uniref:PAS domain S-box protein n=1 Tax=Winslowiella arboricola TaxID=2978220 RepID=A0A9J6PWP8_9GAMM|nr:PAS domain S-box protein [Winslowiella arboricola]MCU5773670.1 PAS domain S-box protein [Winslowiella arboricola]MCU5778431.1 PAS domain S-box protein [Winslowiella arboricola]